jgi:hypothetical protein
MERLLDEQELADLAQCQGFDPFLVRHLRSSRRKIYAAYLKEMAEDFRRIEAIAVERASNDPLVDPHFLEKVLRARYRFTASVWSMQLSLALPFRWTVRQASGWLQHELASLTAFLLH